MFMLQGEKSFFKSNPAIQKIIELSCEEDSGILSDLRYADKKSLLSETENFKSAQKEWPIQVEVPTELLEERINLWLLYCSRKGEQSLTDIKIDYLSRELCRRLDLDWKKKIDFSGLQIRISWTEIDEIIEEHVERLGFRVCDRDTSNSCRTIYTLEKL